MAHKERVVGGLAQAVDFLFRKHGIARVRGTGRIEAPDRLAVAPRGRRRGAHADRGAHLYLPDGLEPARGGRRPERLTG